MERELALEPAIRTTVGALRPARASHPESETPSEARNRTACARSPAGGPGERWNGLVMRSAPARAIGMITQSETRMNA
jgi:hypothetical protein